MTAPTEKAASIPADGSTNTVASILAWHHGRPVPTERDRVVAAEIVEALASKDERLAEDERDRLLERARNEHGVTAMWLVEEGAMLPAQRARARQGGNNG